MVIFLKTPTFTDTTTQAREGREISCQREQSQACLSYAERSQDCIYEKQFSERKNGTISGFSTRIFALC